MSKCIFLDTGVLGFITHPRAGEEAKQCKEWLQHLLRSNARVCIPEICDYELRREYVLNQATAALANLDALGRVIDYVPIATPGMRQAAVFWANVRRGGRATAADHALDADAIACAQALLETREGEEPVFATTNVAHLARFMPAREWRAITP